MTEPNRPAKWHESVAAVPNVVKLRDRDDDIWTRRGNGFLCDYAEGARYGNTGYWPMTVVEVDPEPQPAEVLPRYPDCHECGAEWVEPADRPAKPDPSQPVVLRLPEVPEGTVALRGVYSGIRYTPPTTGELNGAWYEEEASRWHDSLAEVFTHEPDGVTVEFAPPREPRTWPKLDTMPPDISSKIEVEGFGELVWDGRNGEWLHTESRDLYSWGELRALGEVREVIEP